MGAGKAWHQVALNTVERIVRHRPRMEREGRGGQPKVTMGGVGRGGIDRSTLQPVNVSRTHRG
jgi:hypothetical protein